MAKKESENKTLYKKLQRKLTIFRFIQYVTFIFMGLVGIFWSTVEIFNYSYNSTSCSICFLIGLFILVGSTTYVEKLKKELKARLEAEDCVRKEHIMQELNEHEFKVIILNESNNKYFNAIGKTSKLEAKVNEYNNSIIMIKICFYDENNNSVSRIIPFSREYVKNTIHDVVDNNS